MAVNTKPPTVNDDERAQDIYRRAAEIIYTHGFDATSMGEIADTVDLTKGGLYYYIKGKKALLFAIMNFAMDLVESEVIAAAKAEPDPEQRLARLISSHVHLVLQETPMMAILVDEEERLDPDYRPRIQQRKKAHLDFVQESIQAVLKEQVRGQKVNPAIATFSLFGMIHWIVRWYNAKGPVTRDEVAEQISRLALYGLMPR